MKLKEKSYEYEIRRKPVRKLPSGLYITNMQDDSTVVYRGCILTANEASHKIVRNHLAMRSHAKYNGDKITDEQTWSYHVSWLKRPKGPKARLFNAMNRYSWL